MVQSTRNLELLTKKKKQQQDKTKTKQKKQQLFLKPFWQSVDAILKDVCVAEIIV